ncbi:MAG: DUF58 domain-containing protein [Saprospiraceae bacterium]|nr:DUF58 domain-containing protein [Saprospiraceae bacterium]
MDTKELLKKVRRIEIKTKGLSSHIVSGEYHSAFKGQGMSFAEVRNYQYGDDIRNIDWNVTARTGEPFTKTFEEERELTVMLLVDLSGSAFFGSRQQFKQELMTELAAVLAFSAINNQDKVGLILFSDKMEQYIPAKKGKKHILRIIRELVDYEPTGKGSELGSVLEYLNNVIRKRCIAFVLSDFMMKGYESAFKVVARKHDLIGARIWDPLEASLPNVGLVRAVDSETGQFHWLDTSRKSIREEYAQTFEDNGEFFRQSFRKAGASTISLRTDQDYLSELIQFFKRRSRR